MSAQSQLNRPGSDFSDQQKVQKLVLDRRGIGLRLKRIRAATKLSQKEFGAIIDISWRSYQNYEIGTREMPLQVAMRIALAFNVSVEWLALGGPVELDEERDKPGVFCEPEEGYGLRD